MVVNVFLAALAPALVFAALPVRVESSACPSGAEVEEALAALLPAASDGASPDVARVQRRDGKLRIELVDANASVIAERELDASGSCTDLARLVAVVIGSWEGDAHAEITRPHAEPPAPVAPMPAVRPSASMAYDLALGASLSLAGAPAAGGTLAMVGLPWGLGPGLRLSAGGEAARTLDLGQGQVRWRRWMGGVEFDWRLAKGSLVLDLHGGLGLGWLSASGVGFSQNLSIGAFSPAAIAGARLSWWITRHFAAWLDLGGLYWTRSQSVYTQPDRHEQKVPQLLGLASLGLALGRAEIRR
jgi:hypothetical protein